MGSNKVLSSATTFNDNELPTKEFVDDNYLYIKKESHYGGIKPTLHSDLMTGNYQIFTTMDPNHGDSLARKSYVDRWDQKSLNKGGGTMTGNITMGGHKIISSSDPTNDTHLARKKYVDDQDNKKLSLTGGTLTGNVTIGNNKIIQIL